MQNRLIAATFSCIAVSICLTAFYGCESCNKKAETPMATQVDTSSAVSTPLNTINLPHGDTSLIPILSKVLDEALVASAQKNYSKLAGLMIYRGPDEKRFGQDVYHARNADELAVVRITSQVFNKWTNGIDSKDYPRVFEMPQPDNKKMEVLEVIFISREKTDREFFGFLKLNNEYKIADVTSNL
jgi:hypothetical protein